MSTQLNQCVSSLVWTFPLCLHATPPHLKKAQNQNPKTLDQLTLSKYNTPHSIFNIPSQEKYHFPTTNHFLLSKATVNMILDFKRANLVFYHVDKLL